MANIPYDSQSSFTLTATDGIKLQGTCIKPKKSICSLIVVHGVGEHSKRYLSFTKKMSASNCTCYIYDQRGHGVSDGKRGHIAKFEDYLSDLLKVYDLVLSECQKHPIFIYGHSMGSIVAILFTLKHQEKIKGLILTGFAFKPRIKFSGYPLKLITFIKKIAPQQSISTMINVEQLCHDDNVWQDYEQDPLINKTVTVSWIAEFYSALDKLKKDLSNLNIPLLMMHGSEDKIARLNGAEQTIQAVQSKDKELHVFKGQRHELLNELSPIPDQVIGRMVDWIRQRL